MPKNKGYAIIMDVIYIKKMSNLNISFEIKSIDAEILLKHKRENESESQAAERLFYERLNAIENLTDEQRTLEGIYIKLEMLQRSLMNLTMLMPYKQPF